MSDTEPDQGDQRSIDDIDDDEARDDDRADDTGQAQTD